jgi:hypothetical protein
VLVALDLISEILCNNVMPIVMPSCRTASPYRNMFHRPIDKTVTNANP